jgi:high-affinity iron transporter
MGNVFSVQIYFVTFRETLEASIIISILLSFVKHGLQEGHNGQNEFTETHLYQPQEPRQKSVVTEKHGEVQSSPDLDVTQPPVSATTGLKPGIYNNSHNKLKRKKAMNTFNSLSNPAIYRRWQLLIWLGSAIGLLLCVIIGSAFIAAFYARDDHPRENLWIETGLFWEGILAFIASIFISLMGGAMLHVNKQQQQKKWHCKMTQAVLAAKQHEAIPPKLIESLGRVDQGIISVAENEPKEPVRGGWRALVERLRQWTTKYAMALLPFVTVLREGLEAMMVISGVALATPGRSIPLPAFCGIATGSFIGFAIYRSGNSVPVQWFLIANTCLLYLLAAGLFSRAVWLLEKHMFTLRVGSSNMSEAGMSPGSYNTRTSVWHVNCCSPRPVDGSSNSSGWQIFGAILGWQNSATYGSVIAYNVYWLVVTLAIVAMWYWERYSIAKRNQCSNQLDQNLLRKRGEIGSLQLRQRQEQPQDLELQQQQQHQDWP